VEVEERNPEEVLTSSGFLSSSFGSACLLRARALPKEEERNPEEVSTRFREMIVGINRSKEQQRLSSK